MKCNVCILTNYDSYNDTTPILTLILINTVNSIYPLDYHIAIVKLVLSINNSYIIRTRKYNADFGINVRENRRDNQVLNIQRNWQQDTRQRQKNTSVESV
jgi:hypothetical protein